MQNVIIMSKLLFLIVLLFPLSIAAQWNHIYTSSSQIYALDVISPDTVFVVGFEYAGYTHDGGSTWYDINHNCNGLRFRDVEFPTNKYGYIVGINGKILKSSDYGISWQDISPDSLTEFVEAEFISPDTGWIIGNLSAQGDIILRTYDGGGSWHYSIPNAFDYMDIQMIGSEIGYALHLDGILKTVNGGDSWYPLTELSGTCCSFISADTGYVGAGGLYMTLNGGGEWTYISDYLIGYFYRSQLQFLNQDTGYYTGYDGLAGSGRLSTTIDGGNSWNHIVGDFCDIDMYCDTIGYCIKWTGEIFKTTTGGIIVGTFDKYYEEEPILVYPNPSSNTLNIEIPNSYQNNSDLMILKLANMYGEVLFVTTIPYSKNMKINHFQNLPSGSYVYTICSSNKILKTGKLIKSK